MKVTIDKNDFLPSECGGGVEMLAKEGKINVVSTLESRLEQICDITLPQTRNALFGENKNRKFFD